MGKILIIDDSELTCAIMSRVVRRMGHEAESAGTLQDGLKAVATGDFDVVLLDVLLPDGNGLEVLPRIHLAASSPEVIIITSEGDPSGAAMAIENGAWDYLEKGASADRVTLSLARALLYREKKVGVRQGEALKREGIIGSSRAIRDSLDQLGRAAGSDASVLITGETGTGKELAARAIHANSARAGKPFVVVDCAALPDTLVESILFGHVKGAFTGADRDSEGLVLSADGGTLFLDEVGELPMALQKAFLRVLQDRRFRPVGGKSEVQSDFRLVSATNRDLDEMAGRGSFRSDLLFRIKSFQITLPALRDRDGDIREIASLHIDRLCELYGLESKAVSPDFFEALEAYVWPGNVRELLHCLERAVIKARQEPRLFPKHLPTQIRTSYVKASITGSRSAKGQGRGSAASGDFPRWRAFREETLQAAGRKYFQDLMAMVDGDIHLACEISGLSQPRLYALLKEHAISRRYVAEE